MSNNAKYCKAVLFSYFRFGNQASHIASECGNYYSDILLVKKEQLIEVEVKVSKVDFKNDFKKDKHRVFNSTLKENFVFDGLHEKQHLFESYQKRYNKEHFLLQGFKRDMSFIPNKFYFAVPSNLVEFCSEYLKNNYPQYGLIEIKDEIIPWMQRATVVKQAKTLHKRKVNTLAKETISSRMGSELANMWQKKVK
jgi:hypothetical protein